MAKQISKAVSVVYNPSKDLTRSLKERLYKFNVKQYQRLVLRKDITKSFLILVDKVLHNGPIGDYDERLSFFKEQGYTPIYYLEQMEVHNEVEDDIPVLVCDCPI